MAFKIDKKTFDSLPKEQKLIILVISIALVIYIDYSLILKNQITILQKINPRVNSLSSQIKTAKKDIKSIPEMELKLSKIKERATVITQKIVDEDKIPALLEKISSKAQENNIKIMQIRPIRDAKAKELATTQTGKYFNLDISLDVRCGYHNLGKFLNELENMGQFIKLQSLGINSDSKDYYHQQVKISLGTIIIKKN